MPSLTGCLEWIRKHYFVKSLLFFVIYLLVNCLTACLIYFIEISNDASLVLSEPLFDAESACLVHHGFLGSLVHVLSLSLTIDHSRLQPCSKAGRGISAVYGLLSVLLTLFVLKDFGYKLCIVIAKIKLQLYPKFNCCRNYLPSKNYQRNSLEIPIIDKIAFNAPKNGQKNNENSANAILSYQLSCTDLMPVSNNHYSSGFIRNVGLAADSSKEESSSEVSIEIEETNTNLEDSKVPQCRRAAIAGINNKPVVYVPEILIMFLLLIWFVCLVAYIYAINSSDFSHAIYLAASLVTLRDLNSTDVRFSIITFIILFVGFILISTVLNAIYWNIKVAIRFSELYIFNRIFRPNINTNGDKDDLSSRFTDFPSGKNRIFTVSNKSLQFKDEITELTILNDKDLDYLMIQNGANWLSIKMLSDRHKKDLKYFHKICLLAKNRVKMQNSSSKPNCNKSICVDSPFDQNNLTVTLAVPEYDELTESHFDEISLGSRCEILNSHQLQLSECGSLELKSEIPRLLENTTSSFSILNRSARSRLVIDVDQNDIDLQDNLASKSDKMKPVANEPEHQYDFISEQFQANINIANRNTPTDLAGTQINDDINHRLKLWDLHDIGDKSSPNFERSNVYNFHNSHPIHKSLSISYLSNLNVENRNYMISNSQSLPNINFPEFSTIKNSQVQFCRTQRHESNCRVNDFIENRIRADDKSTQTDLSNKHVMTNTADHIYDDLNYLENDFNMSPLYESISLYPSESVHLHANTIGTYNCGYVDKSSQAVTPVSNALTCTETTYDYSDFPESDSEKIAECNLKSTNLQVTLPVVNSQIRRLIEMADCESQYDINDCELILPMNSCKNICVTTITSPENYKCDYCRTRLTTTSETTSPTFTIDSAIQCEYEPMLSYSALQLSIDPLTSAAKALEIKPMADERMYQCEKFTRCFVDAATECNLVLPNAHECRCSQEHFSDVKLNQIPDGLSMKHYSEASTECDLAFATKFDSFSQTANLQTHDVESQCGELTSIQENGLKNSNSCKIEKHNSCCDKKSESKITRDFGCQKMIPAFTKGVQNVPHQKAVGTQARTFVKHSKLQFPEICENSEFENADSSGDEVLELQELGEQESKTSISYRPYINEFDNWNNSDWMSNQNKTELMKTDRFFLKLDEPKSCFWSEN